MAQRYAQQSHTLSFFLWLKTNSILGLAWGRQKIMSRLRETQLKKSYVFYKLDQNITITSSIQLKGFGV